MKEKILFLHHNFPAQFRFIALDLAKAGHEVVFLSERNSTGDLAGIRQIPVPGTTIKHNNNLQGQLDCSSRYRLAMEKIRDSGWIRQGHSKRLGLWLSRFVFPESHRICYLSGGFE